MRMSLCMIVWQEEKALARCLEGIADAVEEIVIVDMGSTDRTKEIARQFTDKIYDFPWMDDFAAARNFCVFQGDGRVSAVDGCGGYSAIRGEGKAACFEGGFAGKSL